MNAGNNEFFRPARLGGSAIAARPGVMGRVLPYAFVAALFCLALSARLMLESALQAPDIPVSPKRIVSLAPSVTETLYAIGLGDAVVGVTQFCVYPPEVLTKPKVAGFGEVNYEAVARLRPDLVVLPLDKVRTKKELEDLGLTVLALDTRSMWGLMDAIRELGQRTGHTAEADAVLAVINSSLEAARDRALGRPKPRVLFSIMHAYQGLGYITEIHAVGDDGFYSELMHAAGGSNAYDGALAFPRLSREAVIFLNPEVIIDVVIAVEDTDGVRRDWETLSSVSAIKNHRLYLLTDEADTVPGPRFYQTLTRLSHAFYPSPGPGSPASPPSPGAGGGSPFAGQKMVE